MIVSQNHAHLVDTSFVGSVSWTGAERKKNALSAEVVSCLDNLFTYKILVHKIIENQYTQNYDLKLVHELAYTMKIMIM